MTTSHAWVFRAIGWLTNNVFRFAQLIFISFNCFRSRSLFVAAVNTSPRTSLKMLKFYLKNGVPFLSITKLRKTSMIVFL